MHRRICFGSWALCVAWASWRALLRAARELLWLASIITTLIPLVHGIATGWWFWRSAMAVHGALLAIDLGALALAVGFAELAGATSRRGNHGDSNSVWAMGSA